MASRQQSLGAPLGLNAAGVEPEWIYADVAISGTRSGSSRAQWQLLDRQIVQGDVLIVVALDRLGRRYPETMWAITTCGSGESGYGP